MRLSPLCIMRLRYSVPPGISGWLRACDRLVPSYIASSRNMQLTSGQTMAFLGCRVTCRPWHQLQLQPPTNNAFTKWPPGSISSISERLFNRISACGRLYSVQFRGVPFKSFPYLRKKNTTYQQHNVLRPIHATWRLQHTQTMAYEWAYEPRGGHLVATGKVAVHCLNASFVCIL